MTLKDDQYVCCVCAKQSKPARYVNYGTFLPLCAECVKHADKSGGTSKPMSCASCTKTFSYCFTDRYAEPEGPVVKMKEYPFFSRCPECQEEMEMELEETSESGFSSLELTDDSEYNSSDEYDSGDEDGSGDDTEEYTEENTEENTETEGASDADESSE